MTNNTWDQLENELKDRMTAGDGDSLFIKLVDDGDKVTGAFRGDPQPIKRVWTGTQYENYDPELHPEEKPRTRYLLNFFDVATSSMRIIDVNSRTFGTICKVRKKYSQDHLFEVERSGAKGDQQVTFSVMPEGQIDDALLATMNNTSLHDLAKKPGDGELIADDSDFDQLGA